MRVPSRRLSLAGALIAATIVASCGGAPVLPAAPSTRDPLAGVYSARGGGGALEAVIPLTRAFAKLHPGVIWQGLDDVGSDAGIKLVQSGDLDLSFISREPKSAEAPGIVTVPIGATGTGVAVSASNAVAGLTRDQLAKIFRGELTDWRDVGGAPGSIHVLMREVGAATRAAFEAYCFGGKPATGYAKNAIEVNSYDETVRSMKSFQGSIGIMSVTSQSFAEASIRFLAVDGVSPTRETLADGTYRMRRPLYLVYPSDPAKVKPAIRAFIDFVNGPEGQHILATL
jgi:phosphate transport system substrate-binding protein